MIFKTVSDLDTLQLFLYSCSHHPENAT